MFKLREQAEDYVSQRDEGFLPPPSWQASQSDEWQESCQGKHLQWHHHLQEAGKVEQKEQPHDTENQQQAAALSSALPAG